MKHLILPLCLIALFGYGCVEPIPAPPHTVAEFTELQRSHPQQYARSTVMQYNIQRVLDPDLPTSEREGSLDLISSLVGPSGKLPVEVSAVLVQSNCPPTLRSRILGKGVSTASGTGVTLAAGGGTPNTSGGVTNPPAVPPTAIASTTKKPTPTPAVADTTPLPLDQLATAPAGPRRRATLRQLIARPDPSALPNLCKAWASEPANGSDEQLFRQAAASLGASTWQDVLLNALNADRFAARGSALSVLSVRRAEIGLLSRIKSMTARTVSVQAMKTFAEKFDYIPESGGQLLACVIVRSANSGSLDAAAGLAKQWVSTYNYKFNIRDFHLLNHLASDPLRNKIGRDNLIKQITTRLQRRRHANRNAGLFNNQAASMTMPDLWNIVMLDDMLKRRRVSVALKILAQRLRAGLNSPRSGLVFYESGKASAKLYPQAKDSSRGDRDHIPERELQRAGFDALCHLHTRFEKVYNGDRAAPSGRELSASKQANFYGLTLASVDSGTYSAFYYTPNGRAVSLGIFAFGK